MSPLVRHCRIIGELMLPILGRMNHTPFEGRQTAMRLPIAIVVPWNWNVLLRTPLPEDRSGRVAAVNDEPSPAQRPEHNNVGLTVAIIIAGSGGDAGRSEHKYDK